MFAMHAEVAERTAARALRRAGWPVRPIAIQVGVSIGSVSVWVRDLPGVSRRRPRAAALEAPVAGTVSEDAAGEVKRCGRCERTLPIWEFNRHPTRDRQHWCRSCFSSYFAARGARHRTQSAKARTRRRLAARRFVETYLEGHPCVDCGESDRLVLEFDHVEPKRADVSHLTAAGWSVGRIEREIDRCEVVCVNCHRRRTAGRGISWRNDPTSLDSSRHLLPNERRNMLRLRQVLEGGRCVDCGVDELLVLEFDHIGAKRGNLVELARRGCSSRLIDDELSRCEIRCANCHRRRTKLCQRAALDAA